MCGAAIAKARRDYTQRVIQNPEDWRRLPLLEPRKGFLGAEIETLRLLVKELRPDTPIIQTIFNPLSQRRIWWAGQSCWCTCGVIPRRCMPG